jgi:glucose/arabinose dehydrogenase
MRWLLCLLSVALILSMVACGGDSNSSSNNLPGNNTGGDGGSGGNGGSGGGGSPVTLIAEDVATGLTVPWEMVWAPDGRMFFTEQRGRLRVIENGQLQAAPVLEITNVTPGGEAGLTGLEIDPNFAGNGYLYVYYCYLEGQRCKVARLVVSGNSAQEDKTLVDFDSERGHNAGRIKIGPDGLLYVAVGDFHLGGIAQDPANYGGKILRMNLDGSAAGVGLANPYVYTLGHRDPQGLAFDSSGALYSTEHGQISHDEVNLLQAGANYGWPDCEGICNDPRFVDPIKLFELETAAPSGGTFYYGTAIPQWNGSLLFGTLGLADNTFAHHVHRIKFNAPGGTQIVEEEVLYKDTWGRIRNVLEGPDQFVYILTSNGNAADKIIRVRPQ